MNKVITINLNNNAYQLEETGYRTLQDYLEKAAADLADNPDKQEIIADLEQAIADKCDGYLKAHKTVITSTEVDEVVASMGPIEGDEHETQAHDAPKTDAPRRLFKIRDGAVFEGVCNGVAAYFDVDPTLVRVGFIMLTVLSGGAWIIVYILMALFVPEARTREDVASARGKTVNAQTIMESARERYAYWKDFGKEQQTKWKAYERAHKENQHHYHQAAHTTKHASRELRQNSDTLKFTADQAMPRPGSKASRGIAGIFGGLGSLLLIGITIAWCVVLFSIFTTGAIFGVLAGVSIFALLSLALCVFYLVFLPIQAATGVSLRYAKSVQVRPRFWGPFWVVLTWFAALAGLVVLITHVPQIHDGAVRLWHMIGL